MHLPETSHDDVIGLQQAAIEKLFVGHLIHIHEQWLHITNVHISELSQGVSCWSGNIEQTKSISWGLGGDGVSQVWSAVVRSKSGHYNLHNLHPLGDFICVKMCVLPYAMQSLALEVAGGPSIHLLPHDHSDHR